MTLPPHLDRQDPSGPGPRNLPAPHLRNSSSKRPLLLGLEPCGGGTRAHPRAARPRTEIQSAPGSGGPEAGRLLNPRVELRCLLNSCLELGPARGNKDAHDPTYHG